MQTLNFSFNYSIGCFSDGLSLAELQLRDEAIVAAKNAYAPYSKFSVGASVLLNDGSIVSGNNQENGAYPSGLCAERVALFAAQSAHPNKKIVQMAVVAFFEGEITENPITPCGSCRQVMLESSNRQKKGFKLLLFGRTQTIRINDSSQLMPLPFVFANS